MKQALKVATFFPEILPLFPSKILHNFKSYVINERVFWKVDYNSNITGINVISRGSYYMTRDEEDEVYS